MRIMSRYMAKAFFRPFVSSLALFALLVFLGHVFDRLTVLLRTGAPLRSVAVYLLLQVPYWTVRIVPMATLLATLLCVSELVKSGEWVAMLASGYRPGQVFLPLAGCGVVVALLAFAGQETIFPYASREADRIYEVEIKKRPEQKVWKDVVFSSRPDQFLVARVFDPAQGRMSRVVMDSYGGSRVQLDALEAEWDGRQWIFLNGVRRVYDSGGLSADSEQPFDRLESDLSLAPDKLVPDTQDPDNLSLGQALKLLSRLKRVGGSTRQAEVAVQSKLAYPFSNLVVLALGLPFGLRMRRANRSLCFAGALAIGFVYWWGISMTQTLGEAGILPPYAAAWTGNVLFTAVGMGGLAKSGL